MKMHYDKRNDHICCDDAYSCKDILKSKGFRWNPNNKAWFRQRPQDGVELGNLVCELYIECGMDYYDLCDFLASLPAEISATVNMDAAHLVRFQAATADI